MSIVPRALSSIAGLAAMFVASAALAQKATPAPSSTAPLAASSAPQAAAPKPATPESVRSLGDAFSQAVERVGPSVVRVEILSRDEASASGQRAGAGVVLTRDGAILTSDQLIETALSIQVRVRDGRLFAARLIGRDPVSDLAVLRVDAADLSPARFAAGDTARLGEWVLAIGSLSEPAKTVTTGVLSARGRAVSGVSPLEDLMQTDAVISASSAGGPLVNLDGEVIGINTTRVSGGQGVGFAVPASVARRVSSQLLAKGRVERPFLGVSVQDLTPALAEAMGGRAGEGALVSEVIAEGPGAKGNLKTGDVIVRVGNKRVGGAQDFIRETLSQDVGATVKLDVLRGGKLYGAKVVIGAQRERTPALIPAQQIAQPADKSLGLTLQDASSQKATPSAPSAGKSCVVSGVVQGSAAERAGLRAGDVVLEADGLSDPSAEQVLSAAADGKLLLRVRRQDASFFVALKN